MNDARLTYLFHVYLYKTATEAEREEFMQLLALSEHDEAVKAMMDKAWLEFTTDSEVFTDAACDRLLANIVPPADEKITANRFTHFRGNVVYYIAACAAALILFFAGLQIFKPFETKEQPPHIVAAVEKTTAEAVIPGGPKAILTLSDGSNIILDTTRAGMLAHQGNTRIMRLNQSTLAYNSTSDKRTEVVFNTLSTPNGGQYQLVLPDGSKVWLNASSSIYFPTRFEGKQRQVTVTGEAYFEVAKNASMPFVISVRDAEIEVLGTAFDVMAYPDELSMNTTLIEGSVKISKGVSEKILKPGQESRISKTGDIQVVQAEVEEVIAWKNGWFQFDGYDIEKVMRQISRWYDVDVVYEGKIPPGHFSGMVSRKNDIQQVLKILEAGGVQFKIQGRKVFITS